MRKYLYYICVVILSVYLASCSSSKHVAKLPMVGGLSGVEYVEKMIASSSAWESFSAKTSLELHTRQKDKTKVTASLKIFRDEAVQLSVAPVLGIEVARLEITPEGLLLVDRMNKRFVRASFVEVSQLLQVEVNFHVLQSLFLNELFLPGKPRMSASDVKSFLLSMDGEQFKLQPKRTKRINYQFFTSLQDGALEKTKIGLRGTNLSLDWDYSDFTTLEHRLFPRTTKISLKGISKEYALHLKMSRLSTHGKWNGLTKLSSKYKQISLAEILKVLLNL